DYYATLAADYRRRRDLLIPALESAGLRPFVPDGAYYVMVDITGVTDEHDVAFARRLTADPGVASVPGSSFYSRPELGRTKVRFAFPKRGKTLAEATRRLRRIG
ncbi:MAG: aminotransferase class I/II-fold pyridoxal phosphate-dependent enzyme, partial [Candidatus Limnocylindria bacterium]